MRKYYEFLCYNKIKYGADGVFLSNYQLSTATNNRTSCQGMSDTVWKVGCYRINPSTPSGQKFFILHMLVLPLIPITALVIQNSVTMNSLLGYQTRVSTIRRQVR